MGIYYRNNWKQSQLELQPAGALIRSRDSPPAATYWLTASLSWYTESPVLTELHRERKHTRCWVSEAKTNWPRYASNVKALASNKHLHIVYVTFSILCILLLLILQIHKLIWPLVKVTLHTHFPHMLHLFFVFVYLNKVTITATLQLHLHPYLINPRIAALCAERWQTEQAQTDFYFYLQHYSQCSTSDPINNNSIK